MNRTTTNRREFVRDLGLKATAAEPAKSWLCESAGSQEAFGGDVQPEWSLS